MKMIVAAIGIVGCLGFAGGVKADEVTTDRTTYTFEDVTLLGELVRPEDASVVVRGNGKARSLVRVRTHFVYEMLKSVETL